MRHQHIVSEPAPIRHSTRIRHRPFVVSFLVRTLVSRPRFSTLSSQQVDCDTFPGAWAPWDALELSALLATSEEM